MLQQAWVTGELIDELAATRQAFGYAGLAGSTPPLATETQPTASTSQQPDDLLPRQLAPRTVQYQLLDLPDQQHALPEMRGYRYTITTYRQSPA